MSLVEIVIGIARAAGRKPDLKWLVAWPEMKSLLGFADAAFCIWGDAKLWTSVRLAFIALQIAFSSELLEGRFMSFRHVISLLALLKYACALRGRRPQLLRRFAVAKGCVEIFPTLKTIGFSINMQGLGQSHIFTFGQEDTATMLFALLAYHCIFEKRRLSTSEATLTWMGLILLLLISMIAESVPSVSRGLSQITMNTIQLPNYIWASYLQQLQAYENASYVAKTQNLLSLPAFVYDEPLLEDEMRLLVLERRKLGHPPRATLLKGKSGQQEECTLPSYTALSFFGYDSTPNHPIEVTTSSGGVMHMNVTSLVSNILYREQSFFSSRAFYLDVICVNASHDGERSAQAVSMRHIYKQARRVNVYLDATLKSSSIGALLNRLTLLKFPEERADTLNRLFEQDFWNDFYEMLDNSWASSTWSLSHVIVAKEVFVVHGTSYFNLVKILLNTNKLAKKVAFLKRLQFRRSQEGNRDRNYRMFQHWESISLTHWLWHSRTPIDFQSLMSVALRKQTLEPRDKVFSSLSLVSSSKIYNIPMSYSLPAKEFWTRVMREALKDGRPDAIPLAAGLSYLGNLDSNDLPSWVSDWNSGRLPQYDHSADLYNASGGATWQLSNNSDIYQLNISVRFVDSLTRISPAQVEMASDLLKEQGRCRRTSTFERINSAKAVAKAVAKAEIWYDYTSRSAWKEAFFRTVLQDRMTSEKRRISNEDIEGFADLIEDLCPVTLPRPESRFPLTERTNAKVLQIDYETRSTFAVNVFAVTLHGYMSMVPEGAQLGDEIVLVAGARKPWLVRRTDPSVDGPPTYQFIGDCYVQDYMDGEFATSTLWTWETITLV